MGAITTNHAETVLADYRTALDASTTLLAGHTRRAYASRVAGYLTWLADTDIDGDPLADAAVRNGAVRDYRSWLKTVRGRSPSTVNAHLTALDHFYAHRGLGAAVAKREDLPAAAPRALEEAEQRKVLRAAEQLESKRDKAIAYILFYTGIRVEELESLDVADVKISARKGVLIVREGKGGRYREIPLHAEARGPAADWIDARGGMEGAESTKALFLNRYGHRLSTRSVDKLIAELGKDARLDEALTPHILRHTFGTRMLRQGADVVLVAELMGHKRLDTTRRYTLPTAADREAAVNLLLTDA